MLRKNIGIFRHRGSWEIEGERVFGQKQLENAELRCRWPAEQFGVKVKIKSEITPDCPARRKFRYFSEAQKGLVSSLMKGRCFFLLHYFVFKMDK